MYYTLKFGPKQFLVTLGSIVFEYNTKTPDLCFVFTIRHIYVSHLMKLFFFKFYNVFIAFIGEIRYKISTLNIK